jgi:radical SAM superfamily enzyme YgiQ (UPF0313 family)
MFIDDDTLLIGASSTMWSSYSSDLLMNIHARSVPENIYKSLKRIKKEYPKIKTVIGGHRAYNDISGMNVFDYQATVTFGEDWLLKLLDDISEKKTFTKMTRPKFSISSHRFVYKEHDCILPGESLPIEWGRGCIFQCPFCRSPYLGKKSGTLEKDIDLMVDEFVELYEKFGTTSYYFIDETFNSDVERIENLSKVYQKLPFKLEFLSYNRADLLDAHPHTQDILHECGQRGVLFGIETFHPEAAKLVKKPWSAKRGKDFLLNLREKWTNTHIDCSLIAGLPGVSESYHYEVADWFMKSNLGFFNFKPLVMVNGRDDTKSVWELEGDNLDIKWPNPDEPFFWEWGDSNYVQAYSLASKLNRYMEVNTRWAQFALGPVTVTGVKLVDAVNKPLKEILSLTGDLYDQEKRIFELYKEKLKTFQGR